MKILKISGKNLASLAGEFCVDFEQEPLASSGLFAISGPTGAGKSTLLDALCLALYDATPRLLKITRGGSMLPDVGDETVSVQDPRNLLRRGAAEAHAEVDFVGNDSIRYRARWSVRRSRGKVGGGLQKSAMTLHRLPDLIALGGTKTEVALEIAQRVGLSFEQFTRAVLLAQNEFSAFLKTEENERGELLETLTGSAVYSVISKRAFERYKAEQMAMQQLAARLADHTPLAAEARAAIEAQGAAADAALAALDERKAILEQQMRWQQEADKLRQNEVQAEAALQAARAEADAAAARRRRLATIAAAQPAAALLAERSRLEAESAAAQAALSAGDADLQRARTAQQQAALALAAAATQLQAAEDAQRAAAPALDQAKALDASIATLAPGHQLAAEARDAAQAEAAQAAAALKASTAELAATRTAHDEGAAWLDRHRHLDALASQWPRWDRLLAQAGQAAALEVQLAAQLSAAQAAGAQAAATALACSAALDTSASQLAQGEAARQHAIAALAAFDAEQLRAARQGLELRREQVAQAELAWHELTATRGRLQQAHAQATELRAASTQAQAALDEALAAAPALTAAFEQADRSLKMAELACAGSVEDLRATLTDGAACPVCGSAEHPYQHQNEQLHALLASLAGEVTACRARVQENLSAQAVRRAILASSAEQLGGSAREIATLEQAAAHLAAAWDAQALAAQAPAEAERAAWLAAQLDAVRTGSQALGEQEQAMQHASLARDAAQRSCDTLAAAHDRQREATAAASTALAQANAAQDALSDKHAATSANLSALLGELDAAFVPAMEIAIAAQATAAPAGADRASLTTDGGRQAASAAGDGQAASTTGDGQAVSATGEGQAASAADGGNYAPSDAGNAASAPRSDWQAEWRQDTAQFRAARGAEAREWSSQSALHTQRTGALATLGAEHGAAALRADRANAGLAAAQAEFARVDTDIGAKQLARRALWDGKPVRDVEQALAAAIEAARAALAAQQTASQQAAQAETRALQALAHAGDRLAALAAASAAANDKIAAWLAAYPLQHPTLDPIGDAAALASLLALDAAATAQERAALEALDARAAAAATVLGERRAQRQQHLQTAPPDGAAPADALAAALAALLDDRKAAHDAATALRLHIAQDNVRREQAQTMMAEIERQQLVERRWGKLSELIGSSDGKKFRNYAQQFTLDVLLGYANSHLAHLARRYRLERVASAAGPSLGLLVRDQDMGGEIRSVNSLSGGESFLVSLALALGLASLSSNRVRVESLFIDEGFGSLDSETLGVAMDALDGLQSMGRKVGVISHVQEMTERIATRILVQPSGGGSSSVTVQ